MKRRLLIIGVSTCLAVVAVLWVRSYLMRDCLSTTLHKIDFSATFYLGGIHFVVIHDYPYGSRLYFKSVNLKEEQAELGWPPEWDDQYPAPQMKKRALGFGYVSGYYNLNPEDNGLSWMPYSAVVFPFWLIALLLAVLIMFVVVRRPRRPV